AATAHNVEYLAWKPPLPRVDVVIHLAGESIAGWWTKRKRARILRSRIETTRWLVEQMRQQPPRVFLSASAVGFYGNRPGEILTEDSPADPRSGFRSVVCRAWEKEASRARELGIRTIKLRFGNVLGPSGGYLAKLEFAF